MRVANESHWNGDDIRHLVERAATALDASIPGKLRLPSKLRIRTLRSSKRRVAPSVGHDRTCLTLSISPPRRFGADPVSVLANVANGYPHGTLSGSVLCELLGSIEWGLKHVGDLPNTRFVENPKVLPEWARDLVVRPKVIVKKGRLIGEALQKTRIAEAEKKLVYWERRLKLAKTKVKKYSREVRRREKALQRVA